MAKLPAPLSSALTERRWADVPAALERALAAKEPVIKPDNIASVLAWALVEGEAKAFLPGEAHGNEVTYTRSRQSVAIDEANEVFIHLLPVVLAHATPHQREQAYAQIGTWVGRHRNQSNRTTLAGKEPLADSIMLVAEALVRHLPRKDANQALVSVIERELRSPLNPLLLERLTRPSFLDLMAQARVGFSPAMLLATQGIWLDDDMRQRQTEQEDPQAVQARVVDRVLGHPDHLTLVRTELNPIKALESDLKTVIGKSRERAMMLGQALLPLYEARNSAYTDRLKALVVAPAFEEAISTGRLEPLQSFLTNNPAFIPEKGWEKAQQNVAERMVLGTLKMIEMPGMAHAERRERLESVAEVLEFVLINWNESPEESATLAGKLKATWDDLHRGEFLEGIAASIPHYTPEERQEATERVKWLDRNPVLEVLRNVGGKHYTLSSGEVLQALMDPSSPAPAVRRGPRP